MLNHELTTTEESVLSLLAEGLSNPEIALELSLSRSTIRYHLGNVYGKLGVATRTEAVAFFLAEETSKVVSKTPEVSGKTYTADQIRFAAKELKKLGYDQKATNALITDLLALLG